MRSKYSGKSLSCNVTGSKAKRGTELFANRRYPEDATGRRRSNKQLWLSGSPADFFSGSRPWRPSINRSLTQSGSHGLVSKYFFFRRKIGRYIRIFLYSGYLTIVDAFSTSIRSHSQLTQHLPSLCLRRTPLQQTISGQTNHMAEGREGNGRGARPKDKAADRVNVHRVNDFALGHVGQIAYEPIVEDDGCVGTLRFSRWDEYREFKSPGLRGPCCSLRLQLPHFSNSYRLGSGFLQRKAVSLCLLPRPFSKPNLRGIGCTRLTRRLFSVIWTYHASSLEKLGLRNPGESKVNLACSLPLERSLT